MLGGWYAGQSTVHPATQRGLYSGPDSFEDTPSNSLAMNYDTYFLSAARQQTVRFGDRIPICRRFTSMQWYRYTPTWQRSLC